MGPWDHLGKYWAEAVEHVVVAEAVAQLPLLHGPRNHSGEEQRFVHLWALVFGAQSVARGMVERGVGHARGQTEDWWLETVMRGWPRFRREMRSVSRL